MAKKTKQKPVSLVPPKDITELGERFIRLGEALKDENSSLGYLGDLSLSCSLEMRLVIAREKPRSRT